MLLFQYPLYRIELKANFGAQFNELDVQFQYPLYRIELKALSTYVDERQRHDMFQYPLYRIELKALGANGGFAL